MLVWSVCNETLYAERALRAGAMGYIDKEQATVKIIDAIRHLIAGKVYLSESMADRVLHRAIGSGGEIDRPAVESLSDRELEVFQFIGQGLTTQQIAAKMHVSPKTVDTYRARIREKLKISSGTELIRLAVHSAVENA